MASLPPTTELLVRAATIEWRDSQCFAPDFDDIYFQKDAQSEIERVFLRPTELLPLARRTDQVTVGELGFGAGLNFAVTAQAVLTESGAHLHFVSVEKYPLSRQNWERVAGTWGAKLPVLKELAAAAPPLLRGWHRRTFSGGRVVLSIFHGDASEGIADLAARQRNTVDAWYLDGFAPRRNPEMWSPSLLADVARTVHAGSRAATFSAASDVRRALESVGFEMTRIDQRPYKRESLVGTFVSGPNSRAPTGLSQDGAAATRRRISRPDIRSALVLGAGFGGATIARQLAEQRIDVTVVDPNGIAAGASSIPAALLHGRLLGDGSPTAAHRVAAFTHSTAALQQLRSAAPDAGITPTGAVQIVGPNMSIAKLERIALAYGAHHREQQDWLAYLPPADMVEWGLDASPGLYFPGAMAVDLPTVTRHLLAHPNITVAAECPPDRQNTNDAVTIHCNGLAALNASPTLELAEVHGQIDVFAPSERNPKVPVVGHGYIIPSLERCVIGATYEYTPWDPEEATNQNALTHEAFLASPSTWRHRYRGTRVVTSDRMPVIGPIDERTWIATAYGSMGTSVAPFAAAQLCSEILGWIPPLYASVSRALSPSRFAERQARRGSLGPRWQPRP